MILRLFDVAAPFQQLDERTLDDQGLVIGRDAAAQWVIPDAACEVSRRHCTLIARDGAIVLRDVSSNGVFIGDDRRRAPRDVDLALNTDEPLYLGKFMIVIEAAPPSPDNDRSPVQPLFGAPANAEALAVREDWADGASVSEALNILPGMQTDAAMLEAFCAGAGLDPSSFVGEDPALVMRRVGAIYKQTVLGLGDLLSERHNAKVDLNMDRTTVGAAGNNPFKWAPTRRVAIDLLRDRNDGFLAGPAALRASFEDLQKHAACLMAGARASIDLVLAQLAPGAIEEASGTQSGFRLNKHEMYWRQLEARHDALRALDAQDSANPVSRAFKHGYESQLRDLDEVGTRS